MAWTTPRTWSPGETVTATIMNTHVRDNLNALRTDVDSSLDGVGAPAFGSWVADGTFLIWPSQAAVKLAHFTSFGTAPTIARTGAGQADTQGDANLGGWGLKMTRGAAAGGMQQTLLHATGFPLHMRSKYFAAGVYCRTTVANSCRLELYDGVTSAFSPYHDGTTPGTNNGYQLLTVVKQLDAAATQLILKMNIELAGSAYWSGVMAKPGSIAPTRYFGCPIVLGSYVLFLPGTLTTGPTKWKYVSARPGIVRDTQLYLITSPTGAAFIVDVNTFDGSGFTSMYLTKPQCAAGTNVGGAQPDTTWERRCIDAYFGNGGANGAFVSLDVDQVGSTVAGSDATVRITVAQYARPQEIWLPVTQVN